MQNAFDNSPPAASTSSHPPSQSFHNRARQNHQYQVLASKTHNLPNFYVSSYKHKGIFEVEDSADTTKLEDQFCFAYNLPGRGCLLGKPKCPCIHRCMLKAAGKITEDVITSEEEILQDPCGSNTVVGLPEVPLLFYPVQEVLENPKFLRGYVWDSVDSSGFSLAIESSVYANPFPEAPPLSADIHADFELNQFPFLFKIVTPVNVDKFKTLLLNHPNRPFVKSGLKGLRKIFWPCSSIPDACIMDGPNQKSCASNQVILDKKCEEEVIAGRYSEEFTIVLEGMKVIPLLMVSKKESKKMRVCSNMSAGHPSPNDLIDKHNIPVAYDSLKSFIPFLIDMKEEVGEVLSFKSDIENAFRTIRLYLQYQIRQILKIRDDKKRVDRNLTFGSSASPYIWCGVFSLVLWIAEFVFNIKFMNNMIDDVWCVCPKKDMMNFKAHIIPTNQAKLLNLCNILGFPWVWDKQIHGTVIEIIGHVVDSEKMIMYLQPEKKALIVKTLQDFVTEPSHSPNDWQKLLGHASWACSSMPWGQFALQSLYEKAGSKGHRFLQVPVNKENQNGLRWLIDFFKGSSGVQMLRSLRWNENDAESVYFTDACMYGIGIWDPVYRLGFHFILPSPLQNIFWAELLGVICSE